MNTEIQMKSDKEKKNEEISPQQKKKPREYI